MNNFETIRKMLRFDSSDDFYFIQIFKRRKDNPGMAKDCIVLKDYYVYSLEQYDNLIGLITTLCNAENARAYIRLNRRSARKTGLQMLKRITDLIISENYKDIKNSYASVAGEYHADPDKSWVVDFDDKDITRISGEQLLAVRNKIHELQFETGREPRMDVVLTKNGYHLITRPFNIHKYRIFEVDLGIMLDVHKDNPTLLYC
jgi:hypothetical protein